MHPHPFVEKVRRSGAVDPARLEAWPAAWLPTDPPAMVAARMVEDGLLTPFQADLLQNDSPIPIVLKGKYRLLSELGQGATGKVFLAEHVAMRRRVAVKLLPETVAQNASTLARFQREAAALATLDHPNMVRAFDCDVHAGLHFLVMEYAEGTDLQRYVQAHGPLPLDLATTTVAQAAAGLHHAHLNGWVHRDVKPNNLFLDTGGRVKVLDLGLARLLGGEEMHVTTRLDGGAVIGTVDYMPPEQSLDLSSVDHRADVYGLGATFFFLLTGRPPFPDGGVAQKLLAHQLRDPPSIQSLRPDVPNEMAALIHRMMAKNPADRPQSLAEVTAALTAPSAQGGAAPASVWTATSRVAPTPATAPSLNPTALSHAGSVESPTPPNRPHGRPSSRVPWVPIALALSLAAASVGALVFAFKPRPDSPQLEPPVIGEPTDTRQVRDHAPTLRLSPSEVVIGIDKRPLVTMTVGNSLGERFPFLKLTSRSDEADIHPGTLALGLDVLNRYDAPFGNFKMRTAGHAEQIPFAAGAGFRQSFEYVGRVKEAGIGISETWSVRVALDGGGTYLLMTTETKADVPGFSTPLRANVVRLRLTSGASADGWSYQYPPGGEVRKDERFFGIPGRALLVWTVEGPRRRGAVLLQHPRNKLPSKFGVTMENEAVAIHAQFGRLGMVDPALPAHTFNPTESPLLLNHGIYLFDTSGNLPDPTAVHAQYLRLAGE